MNRNPHIAVFFAAVGLSIDRATWRPFTFNKGADNTRLTVLGEVVDYAPRNSIGTH